MWIEQAEGALRDLADELFDYVATQLPSGARPERAGWKTVYRAQRNGRSLFLEVIGNGRHVGPVGRRQNVVVLCTTWGERFVPMGERVECCNNNHGSGETAELDVRAGHPEDLPLAREFIRLAFGSS